MPLQGERLRDYALQEHAASLQGVWSGYAGYVRYIVSRGPAPLGKLLLLPAIIYAIQIQANQRQRTLSIVTCV